MLSQVTLRPLQETDGEVLFRFFTRLSGEALAKFAPHAVSFAALEKICREDAQNRFLAVDENGNAVGYLFFTQQNTVTYWLKLAVLDEYTGHGIGRQMVRQAQKIARERSWQLLFAEIAGTDLASSRLLVHNGFVQQGTGLHGGLYYLCDLCAEQNAETHLLLPCEAAFTAADGTPYRIRSLRETDGELLYRFFREMSPRGAALYTPHPTDKDYLDKLCRECRQNESFDRFLAVFDRDGQEVAGGYVFLSALQTTLPSMGIGAAGWTTGKGVGRQMLQFVQNRVRCDYGRAVMRLITHPSNFTAQKLYKLNGFEQVGFAGNGELAMMCDLNVNA